MSVTCSMSCRTVQTSSESSIAEAPFAPFVLRALELGKVQDLVDQPEQRLGGVSEALMNALVKSVSCPTPSPAC